jgi:hypothetical protein
VNLVLRKVLGPKREEVTGGWKKLLTEVLHDLYFLPDLKFLSPCIIIQLK